VTALAEPSRATTADASRQARADTSCLTGADVSMSHPAGNDGSAQAVRDASLPDPRDGSRPCDWCGGPIPAGTRRDAETCSKRCRQARHRFARRSGRAAEAAGPPLRLAYADPPYPGNARLYRGHPDYAGEVDHAELAARLAGYDGWALSTSAAALPAVLALCPPGVRVAAWHRGERAAPSWRPLSAWEPVIYAGGRPVDPAAGRRADSLVLGVSPVRTRPGRVPGAKPAAFCAWVFGLLGAGPADTLDDLYPGSGAVGRAWLAYTGQPSRGT
jgi:hypothetical protein